MFIDKTIADSRLDDGENLVNLVLGLSMKSPNISTVVAEPVESNEPPPDSPLVPEVYGIVKPSHSGRNVGGVEVPIDFKVAAGLLTQFDTIKNVSAALGLNRGTVHEAKNGRTTTGKENHELRQRLDESLSIVRDKAMDRLLSSLNLLDDDKIKKSSAKDIAGITANMAKTMAMTLPKESAVQVNAQLIVYAPTQVNESHFDIVDV